MVNYNNGKIYKIEPISGGEDGDVYIGSTSKTRLCERMSCHRSGYTQWKKGNHGNISVFSLFEKYGVNNCHIILLETVVANSKDELFAREGYWIKNTVCININIAGRSRKECDKNYYDNNMEKIKEDKKQYYKEHRNSKKEYNKKYYAEHSNIIKNSVKQNREKRKSKVESL